MTWAQLKAMFSSCDSFFRCPVQYNYSLWLYYLWIDARLVRR